MKLKKALSTLLALVLLLSCMSITAFAENTEPWADGATPPDNQIFYTATAAVTPDSMTGYNAENSTFDSVSGKGIMAFESAISSIPDSEFLTNEALTGIILPSSVSDIGVNSFYSCIFLASVSMPAVTSIQESAIANCPALTSIFMPVVQSIGENAFDYCAALTYVYAPDSVAKTLVNTYNLFPVSLSVTNGTLTAVDTDFEAVDGCQIYAKYGKTVQFTVTPNEGYKVDSLTGTYNDGSKDYPLNISNGSFTMPRYAVTLTATTSKIQTTGNADLDLEDSTTTIPVSTTIDQFYTKTTASETVTNYKVGVSWVAGNMNIKVADAYKWDYANLTWVTDDVKNGIATMDGTTNVRTFTFTNYSPEALKCNVTFAKDANIAEGQYTGFEVDATDVLLAKVDEGTDGATNEKYLTESAVDAAKLPKATITCTVNPNLEGFKGATANATPTLYGTYTITINK